MNEAIQHLKESIANGKHWHIALLEAIGLWKLTEETYDGRHYRYLIAGEAFDWLLLAERLCEELEGLIPEQEKIDLLFGKVPLNIPKEEFKSFIGSAKYRAYLNYFYGVTVEQALHLVIELETEKELHGHVSHKDFSHNIFQRIYGASESALLERFKENKGYPKSENITLAELDEFTYWLFKYRLANCDSARVASDTKKALKFLEDFKGTDKRSP